MANFNFTAPLETLRLRLRPLVPEDALALKEILGDPEVMYAWESPFTHEEIQSWIEKNIALYARDGAGYMAAELRSNGELIGAMGPLVESIKEENFMGVAYILGRSYWGQGYAFEGINATIQRIFTESSLDRVVADIRPNNRPSRNLAEKLGMKIVGEHTKIYKGITMPHLIYSLQKPS